MSTPEQMRTAVAHYVEEIHRSYVAQALTFPAAVRGRMPLLAPGPLTVAAVGARNLHVLATRDSLGPVRGPEVEVAGSLEGLSWTLRFFDPVVLPELSLIDESSGPAFGEVQHALGVGTVVYTSWPPPARVFRRTTRPTWAPAWPAGIRPRRGTSRRSVRACGAG